MSPPSASLEGLPAEIFNTIVDNIPRASDLNILCKVSRGLNAILTPRLWNTITIKPRSINASSLLNVNIFTQGQTQYSAIYQLRHVKNLQISASFDCDRPKCCPSCSRGYNDVWQQLAPILNCFSSHQLRELRLDIGTCMPYDAQALFRSPSGPKLSSIETLTILNRPACQSSYKMQYHGLVPNCGGELECRKIRNLTWRGLRPMPHLQFLGDLFRHNASHLESLELDVNFWDSYSIGIGPHLDPVIPKKLFSTMLQYSNGDGPAFPALGDLALSNVPFLSMPDDGLSAFNFGELRSLKLHNCRGISRCLKAVVESAQPLKLKVLEISMDDSKCEANDHIILRFLAKCDSLVELCILLKPGMETPYYWEPLLANSAPLKRLVYHERLNLTYPDKTFPNGEITTVFRDIRPCEERATYFNHVPPYPTLENPFRQLIERTKLEFLAVSDEPSSLLSKLQPTSQKMHVKVLHVRASGINALPEETQRPLESNLVYFRRMDGLLVNGHYPFKKALRISGLSDLAQWAFGPRGPPKLQVLAYGDFSDNGRYAGISFLFCRKDSTELRPTSSKRKALNIRLVRKSDRTIWDDVITPFEHLLRACPADALDRECRW